MQTKFINHKLFGFLKFRLFSTSNNQDLHSPYEILGVSPSASLTDIKKAYHKLSKIYHPDKNRSNDASEKFKTINNAYNTLKEYHGEHSSFSKYKHSNFHGSQQKRHTSSYNTYTNYTDRSSSNKGSSERNSRASAYSTEEEKIYEEIFGKSYSSDPMAFYSPENSELRKDYEEKIYKLKQSQKEKDKEKNGEKVKQDFYRQNHYASQESQYIQKKEDPLIWATLGGITFMVFLLLYWSGKEKPNMTERKERENLIEKFREKELRISHEKFEKSKENYQKSLGKMKKYPISDEPDALDLLINHTIYPDIKLYSVSSDLFYDYKTNFNTLIHSNSFEKHKLKYFKLNTAINLSLEAERCLKNIYINVPFLKKELQEKGFYEPPGVFIRFFGFIYIKLRKMPMIADNLKPEKEWISLFELYLRYHSPLPAVHEDFYEFKIHQEKFGWLGNVTLNHRRIPKIFLKGNEKNVFLWRGNKDITEAESKYIFVWNHFYEKPKDSSLK